MAIDQIIITIGGLLLASTVAWYFWFSEAKGTKLAVAESGIQETLITVKGGYSPDVIVVEAGKPVRLNFRREETAACSEQVLFPDFNKQETLTPVAAGILYPFIGLLLSPLLAGAAMAFSSVTVVFNANRLRRFTPKI